MEIFISFVYNQEIGTVLDLLSLFRSYVSPANYGS